jgi:predicted DsbA family dithiol-disulfide isomerase
MILEVFTDFVCPWCYLSSARIKKLRQNFELGIQYAYFPLHPDTPAEGMSLEQLFAGRGLDIERIHARLKALMDAEQLPYGPRTHTYNSRLAQELATWAKAKPELEALHDALYRAYFVNNSNVGDIEVLVNVAESVGLSRDESRAVLSQRLFKDAVDADWLKARRLGITGVPTFMRDGSKLVGCQPYDVLAEFIRDGRVSS